MDISRLEAPYGITSIDPWLAPHAEFFDMRQRLVHGWGGVEAGVFLAVVGYAIFYSGALLLGARLLFNRKRL